MIAEMSQPFLHLNLSGRARVVNGRPAESQTFRGSHLPRRRRWMMGVVILLCVGASHFNRLVAAESAVEEAQKLGAGQKAFYDGLYEQAVREFDEFIQKYSDSKHLNDAKALRGVADGYGQLLQSNYLAAAAIFAKATADFPQSQFRLNATVGEAEARLRLGQPERTVELLGPTNSVFRGAVAELAAQGATNLEVIVRGYLFLTEAAVQFQNFTVAAAALDQLGRLKLPLESAWRAAFLRTRLQLKMDQPGLALATLTNSLLVLAAQTSSLARQADSVMLEGEALERLGRTAEAVKAYEGLLTEKMPKTSRRLALLKLIDLALIESKSDAAIQRLSALIEQFPGDPSLDWAHFTAGELRLKEHFRESAEAAKGEPSLSVLTNRLQQAAAEFSFVITNFPDSQLLGSAYLDRGWCVWEDGEGRNNLTNAAGGLPDFQAATVKLPHSENQAVARFKWADCQFALKDYAGAVTNYQLVLTDYADSPRVAKSLFDQALYQITRASIELTNLDQAERAADRILRDYPDSFYGDRSLLTVGQARNRRGLPREARALFENFARSFTNSALLPEVELAIARTYVQEADWPKATAQYDRWLAAHVKHVMHPQAEFDRAWVNYQAGAETNALAQFNEFLDRYPTNSLAPMAEDWVANYYFNQERYVEAETHYQKLFQSKNGPREDLVYPAYLMAARSAFARASARDAEGYLTNFLSGVGTNAPADLRAEALFALGDIRATGRMDPPIKPEEQIAAAIEVFKFIPSTNRLAPMAWGRIAGCYVLLAALDAKVPGKSAKEDLGYAADYFERAMKPPADLTTRSLAEIGLAGVLEKQAEATLPPVEKARLQDDALDHYLHVFYEDKVPAGEHADPFALKEAGLAAAKLVEVRMNWAVAIKLYERLEAALPQLHNRIAPKLKEARANLDAARE